MVNAPSWAAQAAQTLLSPRNLLTQATRRAPGPGTGQESQGQIRWPQPPTRCASVSQSKKWVPRNSGLKTNIQCGSGRCLGTAGAALPSPPRPALPTGSSNPSGGCLSGPGRPIPAGGDLAVPGSIASGPRASQEQALRPSRGDP